MSSITQERAAIMRRSYSLRHEIWKNRASYMLMAPYFILFFLFTVVPVLMSIYLSFTYFNMLEAPRLIGWTNYVKLILEDDIFTISLRNTLLFAVITGPISYMLCLLYLGAVRLDNQRVQAQGQGAAHAGVLRALHLRQRVHGLEPDPDRRPLRLP